MSPYKLRHRAFTLIELLIVITIIGILAVALIPRLTGGPSRARDAQRKSDLQQLATALEFYANDNGGGYPNSIGCVATSGSTTGLFVTGGTYPLTGYMTTIPADPSALSSATVFSGGCATGYTYVPLNTTGTTASGYAEGYVLVAAAESTTETGSSGIYSVTTGTPYNPTLTGTTATASTVLSGATACTSSGCGTGLRTRYYMVAH